MPSSDLFDYFEIKKTNEFLQLNNFTRVALQFPDSLLNSSVFVASNLVAKTYILADTSYSSCCVDQVAASHTDCQLIIHYGHACHSISIGLPVLFVFCNEFVDIQCISDSLLKQDVSDIHLVFDVVYQWVAPSLIELLSENGINATFNKVSNTQGINQDTIHKVDPQFNAFILYIGSQSPYQTITLMQNPKSKIYSFNPIENKLEEPEINKLLIKRYLSMHKLRDAATIGIIVGTLSITSFLETITRIQEISLKNNKKTYLLSVGKPNPSKLGNFPECECFVFLACPESTIEMINQRDYFAPVCTVFEFFNAIDGDYFIPGVDEYHVDLDVLKPMLTRKLDTVKVNDEPYFSMAKGSMVQTVNVEYEDDNDRVVIVNGHKQVATLGTFGAEYLNKRSFVGLEMQLDTVKASVLEIGRDGIAKGYSNEF